VGALIAFQQDKWVVLKKLSDCFEHAGLAAAMV
jgi:hypothetical protein